MLAHPEVARYLLERGLVSAHSIVAGDLLVLNLTRRNSNFKVISKEGPSYLVKQGIGPEKTATIDQEAAVYRLLQTDGAHEEFRRFIPYCYEYDPEQHVLVIELMDKAENLEEYHLRLGRFPVVVSEAIGHILGTIHSASRVDIRRGDEYNLLPDRPPAVLSVHRPNLEYYRHASETNIHIVQIIQRFPEFSALLDGLRRDWKRDTLIHGDIRWGNWIRSRSASRRKNQPQAQLVDWELACIGDPCWDVGCVFSNYLSFWLLSIPVTGEDPPEKSLGLARYPLRGMQPAMRAFWQEYTCQAGLDATQSSQWLLRAVKYGAARLVQTALEHGHVSDQLTGNLTRLLQVSLNMLQSPEEASVHLLGIRPWVVS